MVDNAYGSCEAIENLIRGWMEASRSIDHPEKRGLNSLARRIRPAF